MWICIYSNMVAYNYASGWRIASLPCNETTCGSAYTRKGLPIIMPAVGGLPLFPVMKPHVDLICIYSYRVAYNYASGGRIASTPYNETICGSEIERSHSKPLLFGICCCGNRLKRVPGCDSGFFNPILATHPYPICTILHPFVT